MKKIVTIFAVVLVSILVISFFKDMMIKASVEKGVQLVTGLKLKTQSFRVGIINTLVGIKNLRLFNPRGYQDKIMLDMPEIYIDYDLGAIIKGKVHLEEMRINMREFLVVKNAQGELNLDSLKVVKAQKEGQKPEPKEKGQIPQIQIDKLQLRIGKVIYKDYSKGGAPSEREFNVNLNEEYENITNPYALVSLIVVKALMNTTIANLTDFDLRGLQNTVSDTLATAQKVAAEAAAQAQAQVKEVAQKTQAVVKETTQRTEEAVKETTKALKKTTEDLKGMLKSPFGGATAE